MAILITNYFLPGLRMAFNCNLIGHCTTRAIDHENAHRIAELLIEYDFIGRVLPVETNILIFEVTGKYNPKEFAAKLKQKDILCIPISATQVRMVTHLDISNEMVNKVLDAIKSL